MLSSLVHILPIPQNFIKYTHNYSSYRGNKQANKQG